MFLPIILTFLLVSGHQCADPIVETPLGKISGYSDTSFEGKKYSRFDGIPYAKPPSRFEAPEPVEPWEGILAANKSTTCAQNDEDCLYINVNVPSDQIDPDANLEVVAYIHGGGFTGGSGIGSSSPLHAMDKDIIFVTFNYRLGIFGFLSTEDDVLPGNNGLKDQVLALKWIQDNIASFGGNPNSVTLVGLSAGSTSVHMHYFSPLSKGLFHRGFAQSGTAVGPTAIVEGNLDRAKKLAASLQCPTEPNRDLVDCLKQVPTATLRAGLGQFYDYPSIPIHPFGPVVERPGPNAFLTEDTYIALSKGQIQDLPFMTSNTLDEGLLFTSGFSGTDWTDFDKVWPEVAPVLFDFNYTLSEEGWADAAGAIKEHYFGEKVISQNKDVLKKAFNDRFWYYGSDVSIKLQANVSKSPVYYFVFGYPGDSGTTVGHGSEAVYMFTRNLSENGLKMKDLLWDMIVSYAKTNVPVFGSVEGKSTTYQEDIYVEVDGFEDDDIKSIQVPGIGDVEFWDSLHFAENANLVPRV